jgi:hypothetical protein
MDHLRGHHVLLRPEAIVEPTPGGAFFIHMNPYGEPGHEGRGRHARARRAGEQDDLVHVERAAAPARGAGKQRTVVIVRLFP